MPKQKKRNTSAKLSQATLDEIFAFRSAPEKPQKRRRSPPSENGHSDDNLAKIPFEHKTGATLSGGGGEADSTPTSLLRSLAKRRRTRSVITSDEEPSDPPTSSATIPTRVTDLDDGEDGSILRVIPDDSGHKAPRLRKRKLVRQRPPSPDVTNAEDLADEIDEERILDSRLRKRGKRTEFQKNLERLKRKKQGLKYLSSSEDEELESEQASIAGAQPDYADISDGNLEDDDPPEDDSFIVEDDGSGLAELPPEFSMSTHEDLAHQFKKIFQFFVHIATRPPEERHHFMSRQMKTEQYFSVPLQIVRRKLSGLRDSLVASSVWRADFKKALATYPEFALDDLQFALPQCDACHLGGRLSTLIGRLSGIPYDPVGFEDLVDDSESDEDEPHREFHLGRFCARRTNVFHKFTHWEYALFHVIRREIDELYTRQQAGSSKKTFVRIAYAGATQPPDDLTDADAICDYLDSRKVIDMEWHLIKSMMDSARRLEIARAKGDDMDG